MGKCSSRTADFELEGRFLGFLLKDGYKPKALKLSTAAGEYPIKLAKEIRFSLLQTLTPGEWIRVAGTQKLDYSKGMVKLKAYEVSAIAPGQAISSSESILADQAVPAVPSMGELPRSEAPKKQACILVCQKSDCCKKGSRALAEALQAELSDRDLTEVTIRGTGCMKRCKAGPNIVMPDKTRYSQVRAHDIPALVDRHFPTSSPEDAIVSPVSSEPVSVM